MTDLRALAQNATPGPWRQDDEAERLVAANGDTVVYIVELAKPTDDAAYIAAASPDVILRLLDERDAAIRRAEELEVALSSLLEDTQHAHHGKGAPEFCGDPLCPVAQARAALRSQESQKPPPREVPFDSISLMDGPGEPFHHPELPETEIR